MKLPVCNNTAMPIYVGAAMIPPGETRHFDEQEVPHHLRPAPVEEVKAESSANPLAELLAGNVESVVTALAALSIEQLEQLGEAEQLDKKRKGVLGAVAEELLNRASKADLLAKVAAMTDEELAVAFEEMKTDVNAEEDYVLALEAEVAKREAGAAA